MAEVESVRRFQIYLIGVHFKVVTDYSAVRAGLLKRDLVPRIARWWRTIQEFVMEMDYRSGARMQHVDAFGGCECGQYNRGGLVYDRSAAR